MRAEIVCAPEKYCFLEIGAVFEGFAGRKQFPYSRNVFFYDLLLQGYGMCGHYKLALKADGRYYASAAVIDRTGNIVGVYRKTQLTVGEYENGYEWGDELPVFDLDFGKVGVLICWDLWFPEAIRGLRLNGAEVIAYPIAGTTFAHFDTMWKARAMENGIYLAAAISGESDSCPSRIISPAGEVMAETWKEQTYAAATIDLRDPPVNLPWLSVTEGEGETRTFYTHERHPELYRMLTAPKVEPTPQKP